MPRLVRLDALVGRRVRDRRGRSVGRIEEVRAERTERGWVVVEYHLGPGALVERLSASLLLGRRRGRRVRWDQVDV
ncbi:MAG TPA: PRC-barrel domain containing protein, partial [Candidatus Binatia bacterium]|nr:PRC-barrel domain containing protein [Candidatus Binatia bacterium]